VRERAAPCLSRRFPRVPRRSGPTGATWTWGAALAALPRKQREAVAYHYLAGLPYQEVAAVIGGTADAARRSAADGVANLRKRYPSTAVQKGTTR
jgi:hypothetical protein